MTPKEPRHLETARQLEGSLDSLTVKQLDAVTSAMEKLRKRLPEKHPWREHVEAMWMRAHHGAKDKRLAAGKKKDKGEVVFAFCSLKTTFGCHKEFIRTPHVMNTRWVWSSGPSDSEDPRNGVNDPFYSARHDEQNALRVCREIAEENAKAKASRMAA